MYSSQRYICLILFTFIIILAVLYVHQFIICISLFLFYLHVDMVFYMFLYFIGLYVQSIELVWILDFK